MPDLIPISQAPEILEKLLPDNPQAGDIVEMPEGYSCGETHDIQVYDGLTRIGMATAIRRVENVSNVYIADRLATNAPLKPGDTIRILNAQHFFISLKFVEFLGWMGHRVQEPHTVTHDEDYEILETLTVATTTGMVVHEQVCLKQITKEKRHAQPTTNARAGSHDRRTAAANTPRGSEGTEQPDSRRGRGSGVTTRTI